MNKAALTKHEIYNNMIRFLGISSINRGKSIHVAASIFRKRGLGVEVTLLSFAQPL